MIAISGCRIPRRKFLGAIFSVTAVVFGVDGFAAERAVSPAPTDPVVVTATRVEQPSFDLPFSIDSLERGHIHDQQPRVNLSESLVRVPGVVAQNRHNYAQDLQISSRGFGARATFGVRGVRLLTDGIPATMPDGQGQAATFDLDSARRIEVLRGPFSALYGNAAGGVIQMFSEDGPATPSLDVGMLAGSYGMRRASLKYGGEEGGLNYLATLARFETDGYRDHSAAARDTASARLRLQAGPDTIVTLLANALRQRDTEDPLGLTREKMEEDPRQAGTGAEQFNTRKHIDHVQGGLKIERRIGIDDTLSFIGYGGRRDVEQFLAFAGAAPTQSGGVIDLDRSFEGVGVRWTHRARGVPAPLTLSLGVDYDEMKERRRGFVNVDGFAGALQRDEDDRVYDVGHYAQLEWRPAARWRLAAGLRRNRVVFESRDRFITGPNPDDSGRAKYEKTNPMIGVLYQWREAVNLYANAGRGFETPTFAELAYRPDGAAGLNFALRPSVSRHVEAGVKAFVGPATRVNAALFGIRVDDEIVAGPSPAPGRSSFVNAERTTREGFELSIDSRVSPSVQTYIAYTYIDARFENFVNFAGLDLSDNAIPGVPRSTLYGEIQWRPTTGWTTALEARRVAKISVDDANTDAAEAHAIANWRVGYEHKHGGWRIQEYLRVDNLFDRQYAGSVIVNANGGAYFEPAPGRNFIVGLNVQRAF